MTDPDSKVWYCGIDDTRYGPMSFDDLRNLAAQGRLRPSDLVWQPEFGASWRPAATVDGLVFPAPAAAAGMPPPEAETIAMPSTPVSGIEGEEPSARTAAARAWRRMAGILFAPFSFARWCGLALAAFIATIGGGVPSGGSPAEMRAAFGAMAREGETPQKILDSLKSMVFPPEFQQFDRQMAMSVLAFTVFFVAVFSVALCWLRVRATFALLHKTHRPDASVVEAWQVGNAGGMAKSLFLLRVFAGAAFAAVTALICCGALFACKIDLGSFKALVETLRALFPWIAAAFVFGAIYALALSIIRHFVEPVMYWRQVGAATAWRTVNEFFTQCPGAVFRFYVMLCACGFAAGLAVTLAAMLTFGAFAKIVAFPFVGTLALLPVTVFFRAVGFEMLRQWRRDLVPAKLDQAARDR